MSNNFKKNRESFKLKIKKKIKKILFGTEVSTVDFRIRREKLKEIFLGKKERTKMIEFINEKYPLLEIRYLDIGCRQGLLEPYIFLQKMNNFYAEGVEPDKKEAEYILKSKKFGNYKKIHSVALSNREDRKKIYITKMLGCSSLYKPNFKKLSLVTKKDYYEIINEKFIPVTTLSKLYGKQSFDYIQLDVQGSEYDILKGGEKIVKNAIGISFESMFSEIYSGQKLFHHLHEFMLKRGFNLIVLDVSNPLRGDEYGTLDGEIAECGSCVYIKNPEFFRKKEDFLKAVLFSLIWQNLSYAEFIIRNFGDKFLEQNEKEQLIKKLNIKQKSVFALGNDGVSASKYNEGGY